MSAHTAGLFSQGPYLNLVPSPEGTQASFWGQSTLQKASERAVKAAEAVELGDGDAVEHMLVLAMSMR